MGSSGEHSKERLPIALEVPATVVSFVSERSTHTPDVVVSNLV